MQVARLRVANDNSLVPAGLYFARLADRLRASHANAAAVVDEYEAQERSRRVPASRTSAAAHKATA